MASRPAAPMNPNPTNPDHSATPPPWVWRWIKTDCGRAQYSQLAANPGPWARLRLGWFVVIAALRDAPLPPRP